ncbi:Do family serine endopeptidase [Rubinisphaera margarita]|uniref:Do family serine endopeptidase n=1 Tax=Rubinisphaera margarita TaxID=2909586 RepID=UPI001EE97C89|nr:Do family serine endopeptidase [Rubinisphaera margarita]MCG6155110.1 Do family serine endopeptidase [Rubinisphaera margarita]
MSRSVAVWSTGVSCVCLAIAAAVSIGQIQEAPSVRDAETYTARDLATSFRTIAKETFPGIVAIETRGVATVQTQGGLDLEELFKGDPRFERFFKNMPEQESPRRRVVPQGQGSGFIIDPKGFILTNNHVVEGAETITVRLHDGREYQAELIGTDSRSDVAVIKVDAPDLEAIPLGDSENVEVGDIVLAFGSPFGLELTMTQGIISAKGRGPGINEREDYLQTDAAINPGNSGGPLINLRGQVIGINTAISSRSGGYDGVGFSIPINMAKWIADQIMESGEVKRAYIGVVIQPVNNDLANQLGLNVNEGAIVSQIMKDSPADKAGLETGDVILELDGRPVGGTRQLQGIVEQLSVGKSYPLSIYRNGKEKELTISMAQMPQDLALRGGDPSTSNREEETESVSVEDLGVEVQELTKDLAEQFGYSDDVAGVVISSVEPNSVAELNNLRAGEVIEKVGSQRVKSVDDFTAAIEDADLAEGVLMLVRRGPSSRFVVVRSR